MAEKPSFRKAFKTRRCLVPADAFYEWKKTDTGKIPMRFSLKSEEIFTFAGLWEKWESAEETVFSFTVITTTPNGLVTPIHDRMPVILSRANERIWLENDEKLQEILQPYPENEMKMGPVPNSLLRGT